MVASPVLKSMGRPWPSRLSSPIGLCQKFVMALHVRGLACPLSMKGRCPVAAFDTT